MCTHEAHILETLHVKVNSSLDCIIHRGVRSTDTLIRRGGAQARRRGGARKHLHSRYYVSPFPSIRTCEQGTHRTWKDETSQEQTSLQPLIHYNYIRKANLHVLTLIS